jgi:hypothetical protein
VPVHRGIVLNVHDFDGVIEFAQNMVAFNVHFMPEYKQWWQPSKEHGIGLGLSELENFFVKVETSGSQQYSESVKEYRIGLCQEFNG